MAPVFALAGREIIRFLRQRARIVGALATPVVFWLLIGGGVGSSFNITGVAGGANYLQFFFPGTILMILLFTAIFSTISVIEDRRDGFLQAVLIAPVPRLSIVAGKVLGGGSLAFGQGLLFLLLAPVIGVPLSVGALLLSLLVMAILAVALTALGLCLAWPMTSTQGFHAVMNLLLMPMWFLSGALFPPHNAWKLIGLVMLANPLSWGLGALRTSMHRGFLALEEPLWWAQMAISAIFAGVMLFLAARVVSRQSDANLA